MQKFVEQLEAMPNNPVKKISIDPSDFQKFKALYKDERDGIDDQKLLEYYISYTFLDFSEQDTYIDIAAQNCPFAFFVREKFGCKAYRQDLYYLKRGLHGDEIGGDASRLPLKDESVSKISLHNSFEHFEGDSDIHFIQEAQRVLSVGGKMIIVPLFVADQYQIETDAGWIDASGKKRLWGKGARFSRLYDVEQFDKRILQNAQAFTPRFFFIENIREVGENCYGQLFVVFEKTQSVPHRNLFSRLFGRS
jgi:hypothetical protein